MLACDQLHAGIVDQVRPHEGERAGCREEGEAVRTPEAVVKARIRILALETYGDKENDGGDETEDVLDPSRLHGLARPQHQEQ